MKDMQTNNAATAQEAPVPEKWLDAMETDRALDVMMKILPDVAVILNDPDAEKAVEPLKGEKAKNVEAGDAFRALIPIFAQKYKPQLIRIVAACQGCTEDEVRKQSIMKTTAVFASSLRLMTGFFGCCLHMARNM